MRHEERAITVRRCRRRVGSSPTRPSIRRRRGAWCPVTHFDKRAREVHRRAGAVVGVAPVERHLAAVASGSPWVDGLAEALVARRVDGVGGDAVHPDAPRRELERERLGEAGDGGLHRGVDPEAGRGAVGLDRRHVDDRTAGRHHRHRGAHEVGDAAEVLVDERSPGPWRSCRRSARRTCRPRC